MKILQEVIFILLFVLICLFIHDYFTFHPKSEELFFPKLFENECFYLAFDRDIRGEKIISFECSEEMWGGSGTYAEIIMFCYERCGASGEIFSSGSWMDINQKPIAEIEKYSQQYGGFNYFKSILKKEYYRKHQKSLTEAVISHFYDPPNREEAQWGRKMLWYDHNSKILWYERDNKY